MSDSEYFMLMKSLNLEQIQFVYDTIHHLKTSQQPVYRFLSGGAGTGKSYVLRALRETAVVSTEAEQAKIINSTGQ